ncbi:hypothetical protein COV81_03820 [Candidatus Peregrinibacteria bacterium CG11_big_fil_rev_8_21_14_0_20_41_10]|nr:MAG: hypothetical protein COV81_03820 [Candidatus Peregrinibacteria bacterium CG11_big_fil_rev_8_21_14_0_20_41_10]PJC38243.1 MAG: hypothetical protein CO045_01340 [Candidatus Peregrinibacteria bacterium CG_4_9_14_0_2_um_filter_41_14]
MENLPTKLEVFLAATLVCGLTVVIAQAMSHTHEQVVNQLDPVSPVGPPSHQPHLSAQSDNYIPPAKEKLKDITCTSIPCIIDWLENNYLDQLSPAKHQVISQLYYELMAKINDPSQQEIIDLTLERVRYVLIDMDNNCFTLNTDINNCPYAYETVYSFPTLQNITTDNQLAIIIDVSRQQGVPAHLAPKIRMLLLQIHPLFLRLQEFANDDVNDYDELEILLDGLKPQQISLVMECLSPDLIEKIRLKLNFMNTLFLYAPLIRKHPELLTIFNPSNNDQNPN